MSSLESLALRLVSDADFCVALDTDPEAALAACDLELDEIEYSILIGLAPVLTLPHEELIHCLTDNGPRAQQRWWLAQPHPDWPTS